MRPTIKPKLRLIFVALLVLSLSLWALPAFAATTNSSGSFSASLKVPFKPGIYVITATGKAPHTDHYPPGKGCSLSVSRSVVRGGSTVTVTGTGFAPNSTVSLSIDFVSSASNDTFKIASHESVRCSDSVRIRVIDRDHDDDDDDRDDCRWFRDCDRDDDDCRRFGDCDRDRDRDDRDVIVVPQGAAPSGSTTIINNNTNNASASASSSSSSSAGGGGAGGVGAPGRARILVRTGADSLPILLAGTGAILLGSVLLPAGRRKRHARSTST